MKFILFGVLLGFASTAFSASAERINIDPGVNKAVRFTLRLEKGAKPVLMKLGETRLELRPDKEGNVVGVYRIAAGGGLERAADLDLVFWPKKGSRALAGLEGLAEQSWQEKDIPGLVRADGGRLQLWLQGRLMLDQALPADSAAHFEIAPGTGAVLHLAAQSANPAGGSFHEVDLSHLIDRTGDTETIKVGGIPFEVWNEGRTRFSLAQAGWPEWQRDPGTFTETYDGGFYLLGDKRLPLVQVPKADYSAAYLLAYAGEDDRTSNHVTLRAGRRIAGAGKQSQVLLVDFAAEVPRGSDGSLKVVRIPFTDAFAQDVEGGTLDIELTKEIRLARRSPDANRFRWRPLGLPSGVKIAAVTLERSPIQMTVEASQPGALFEHPARASFLVTLKNITAKPQTFKVAATAGERVGQTEEGTIPPGQTLSKTLTLPALPPGYYSVMVTLKLGAKEPPLLVRHTTAGILPADTRQYRHEAPWGTWDNHGEHFTSESAELIGPIMQKLGFRYGMFNFPYAERERYGVIKGNHFKVRARSKDPGSAAEEYRAAREKNPDLLPEVLIFHEDSISGGHATRIPDLFHDRPPYQLNEQEQKRFRHVWDVAVAAAQSIRKEQPEVKLHLW